MKIDINSATKPQDMSDSSAVGDSYNILGSVVDILEPPTSDLFHLSWNSGYMSQSVWPMETPVAAL